MQHLAAVGAGREQRVIPELLGVADPGALLGVPVDLADEGVDVDHQAPFARARAGPPRASQRLAEHAVELAHMPERKRTQKRAQRRGRHRPMPEQRLGPPRPQHIAVIDAVRAQQHRVHQREHLAARARRPRPLPEADRGIDERLDPQPPRERDREHDPGIDDHALIIKRHVGSVRQILHHKSDLLTQAAAARHSRFSPAQEVISSPKPDGSPPPKRWIEAKAPRIACGALFHPCGGQGAPRPAAPADPGCPQCPPYTNARDQPKSVGTSRSLPGLTRETIRLDAVRAAWSAASRRRRLRCDPGAP